MALMVAAVIVTGATSAQQQQPAGQQPSASPTPTPTPSGTEVGDDDVVRVDTDLTNVLFTAADRNKRFITTLKKEDIRVYEDGQPQEIFTFKPEADLPISFAIVIDVSGSQERTLPDEKHAAAEFVDSVVRSRKDEGALLTFTGETTLELDLTSNAQRLRQAIDRVEFIPASGTLHGVSVGTPPISEKNQTIQGSTAVWDAVWVTSNEVLSQTSDQARRALILITDGINTVNTGKKLRDAIDEAGRRDVLVFVVGIGDQYRYGVDEGDLKTLSEQTGGRAYFPRNERDLAKAFEQIEAELRSQYLVAYSPTNQKRDGTFRKVQIEVVNPELTKDVKLTHRKGYFAKTGKTK
jgi:Ca-activated chloride channel family protein